MFPFHQNPVGRPMSSSPYNSAYQEFLIAQNPRSVHPPQLGQAHPIFQISTSMHPLINNQFVHSNAMNSMPNMPTSSASSSTSSMPGMMSAPPMHDRTMQEQAFLASLLQQGTNMAHFYMNGIGETLPMRSNSAQSPGSVANNDFLSRIDAGCEMAERIAIRNQHRPCFRNIHKLCSRTRTEINRPYLIESNIHSQGVPWAIRDFINAYIWIINCWHVLRGYLDLNDGSLGHIDRHFTKDFRTCFAKWEAYTHELSFHMVRIFSNLDRNVSNPAPLTGYLNAQSAARMVDDDFQDDECFI